MARRNLTREATCLGCGATDATGARWLRVERDYGVGVCAECPDRLPGLARQISAARSGHDTHSRRRR